MNLTWLAAFYTRKVKYTQETFSEKLTAILDGFPRLQDIHPFHKDLINTLYDADHFRIALGQLSTAKHLIETVCRDYVRLLKYGQSLYQCKQLKRAALGRMATILKRLKDPLVYLEQVRQHLGRLPSIDPNTRTLLVCGYPNVGKSSFLKSITRADVDVQPYAFTTKSLFVGHFDYKYLRFQAIDTPGILDHPLEDMNTIEMQAITAIAHLRSAILYFMDLSEHCGYSVQAQIQLFHSIKPLFANKLVFVIINKIDITKPEDLDAESKTSLDALLRPGEVELMQLSCTTTEGVMDVRNAVCERLIAERVAQKMKAGANGSSMPSGRLGDVLARIHVAQPLGGVVREPFIPEAVKHLRKFEKEDPMRPRLAREVEEAEGGAGVYNVDLKDQYLLAQDDWKHDKVPEVLNGKNVYDFVDTDIEQKLAALEAEEDQLEAEGFYESDDSLEDADEATIRMQAEQIREKRQLMKNEARMRKSLKNRAIMPRPALRKKLSAMEDKLDELGYDTRQISARVREQSRGRSAKPRSRAATEDAMDVDEPIAPRDALMASARARSQSNRRENGITSLAARTQGEKMAKLGQRKMNRMARQGEADRHIGNMKPKHLVGVLFNSQNGVLANDCPACRKAYYWENPAAVDRFSSLLTSLRRGVFLEPTSVGICASLFRGRYGSLLVTKDPNTIARPASFPVAWIIASSAAINKCVVRIQSSSVISYGLEEAENLTFIFHAVTYGGVLVRMPHHWHCPPPLPLPDLDHQSYILALSKPQSPPVYIARVFVFRAPALYHRRVSPLLISPLLPAHFFRPRRQPVALDSADPVRQIHEGLENAPARTELDQVRDDAQLREGLVRIEVDSVRYTLRRLHARFGTGHGRGSFHRRCSRRPGRGRAVGEDDVSAVGAIFGAAGAEDRIGRRMRAEDAVLGL